LDLVYDCGERFATTLVGRRIYAWERRAAVCESIRARRDFFAQAIEDTARRHSAARVVSVASGHLRERQSAPSAGRLESFIAFDQDAISLATVRREQPHVETITGSVRQILTGRAEWREIDLVYAAGLYDYLAHPVATALTERLFAML